MAFDFRRDFESLTGHPPFPWQARLYEEFKAGEIPSACSIPTGLGKTSVIAVWLIALAQGVKVPRRLVYVVNRRTVVDQTTNEAVRLRNNAHRIGIGGVCISTLRGQFADNREWSADPARPAIICGTVDMIGSRLLFSGYGVGYKSKPLHAGFLGQDVLLIHDEAHLEPAFQRLIETIQQEQSRCTEFAKFRVMQLTATSRRSNCLAAASVFTLGEEDLRHSVARARIEARKRLCLTQAADDKKSVFTEISRITSEYKDENVTVLVFARTVEAVSDIVKELAKTKRPVIQLTGTMRGKERDELLEKHEFKRFLKGAEGGETVYLICTSAGEVGIDISADHMVCDLSTFDSMAQRFGRVNRYGERNDTQIDVVYPGKFEEKDKLKNAREATLNLLQGLDGDASPLNLGNVNPTERSAAFAPEPTILTATDILFDAWSLTSIREKMPGRPPVEPYLHGIAEWQPPETLVAWRREVEILIDDLLIEHPPADLLADYPLAPHELLRDRSDRVYRELQKLAKRHSGGSIPVWVVDNLGTVTTETLEGLMEKQWKERINGCTLLLPPSVGGLSDGVLNGDSPSADDVADECVDENLRSRRMRFFSDDPRPDGPQGMALIRTIDTKPDSDELEDSEEGGETVHGTTENHPAKEGRYWHWYTLPSEAENATRASTEPIAWDHHTQDVIRRTTEIVNALEMSEDLRGAIVLAARLHDLGKKREQWQRGIGNPNPSDWYAKPGKPEKGPRWRPLRLDDYRHEFGSLLDAKDHEAFKKLDDETKDLVLHLIAAHHGRARPHFTIGEALDPDHSSSVAEEMAMETPRRFARLQRKYGRWGLAYLESLLRAADWAASAEPSACIREPEVKS